MINTINRVKGRQDIGRLELQAETEYEICILNAIHLLSENGGKLFVIVDGNKMKFEFQGRDEDGK